MNTGHLEDFIKTADSLELKVGELVSYYTHTAITLSIDGFNPSVNNYDKAYLLTMKKYTVDYNIRDYNTEDV